MFSRQQPFVSQLQVLNTWLLIRLLGFTSARETEVLTANAIHDWIVIFKELGFRIPDVMDQLYEDKLKKNTNFKKSNHIRIAGPEVSIQSLAKDLRGVDYPAAWKAYTAATIEGISDFNFDKKSVFPFPKSEDSFETEKNKSTTKKGGKTEGAGKSGGKELCNVCGRRNHKSANCTIKAKLVKESKLKFVNGMYIGTDNKPYPNKKTTQGDSKHNDSDSENDLVIYKLDLATIGNFNEMRYFLAVELQRIICSVHYSLHFLIAATSNIKLRSLKSNDHNTTQLLSANSAHQSKSINFGSGRYQLYVR
ncbi:uncharacterized protein J8A68_003282 [[Candida] subhashii]|uniref:CCHC-type domain-containing protein n=1 Tax=[Candida] subhashii TaxID=561895 RepID=A0A8J5UWS1_9ASCO|nr:uncharacterized protein J8A68_003282 [[Candida] subhashii]KAG7663200.1 hypothetical protein J8A68_003282 [[Candida] subhashii]